MKTHLYEKTLICMIGEVFVKQTYERNKLTLYYPSTPRSPPPHTRMHTHTHAHTRTHTHTYIYIHTQEHTHSHTNIHTHSHTKA